MAGDVLQGIGGLQGIDSIDTQSDFEVFTVGTSPVQVAINNPNALSRLLINTSGNLIYIGFDAQVTAADGILLVNNGGSYNTKKWEDYALTGMPIWAIGAAAGLSLAILEVKRIR